MRGRSNNKPAAAMLGLLLATALQNSFAGSNPALDTRFGERIEMAYQSQDIPGLEQARRELLDAAIAGPESARAAYFAAYARFRQALVAEADAAGARAYLDDCIGELKALVAHHPADAEARALLGSCYGISTRYNRLGMASRGMAARREMAMARALAPANPWVVMQDGLADHATPRLFGGNTELAVEKLQRATHLFDAEMAAGSRLAAWGASEAWTQLGRMYREAGRDAEAQAAEGQARRLASLVSPAIATVAAL